MSRQQREAVDTLLREAPFDLGGEVTEQRAIYAEMIDAIPVPGDVHTTPGVLGGVPVLDIAVDGAEGDGVVFYLHGGAYAIGSAELAVGLASDVARRVGVPAVSVDYRLAPEHPYPAAVDDAVAAYGALLERVPAARIVIAGESAGAGLVPAMLLALERDGVPQPAAALLMSPWADLTTSGPSMESKGGVDPSVSPAGLRRRAGDYLAGASAEDPLASPLFGDLRGLPPLLIQAGSHEVLLDDATRLAARAGAADVAVTLDITPEVPHVFQAFAAMLDEGGAALDRAARFLREQLSA